MHSSFPRIPNQKECQKNDREKDGNTRCRSDGKRYVQHRMRTSRSSRKHQVQKRRKSSKGENHASKSVPGYQPRFGILQPVSRRFGTGGGRNSTRSQSSDVQKGRVQAERSGEGWVEKETTNGQIKGTGKIQSDKENPKESGERKRS